MSKMSRKKTVLVEKIRSHHFTLMFLLGLGSAAGLRCTHPEPEPRREPPQKLRDSEAEAVVPKGPPLAEPITPPLSAEHPHLASFEGAWVLGNEGIQVVVSGIAPDSDYPVWDGILAVFVARPGGFEPLRLFSSLEWRITSLGAPFSPIGMVGDLSSHPQLKVALRAGTRGEAPLELIYELQEGLTIRLASTQPGRVGSEGLELRFTKGPARLIPLGPSQDKVYGMTLYRGTHLFGFWSDEPTPFVNGEDTITLTLPQNLAKKGLTFRTSAPGVFPLHKKLVGQNLCALQKEEAPCQGTEVRAKENGLYHPLYQKDQAGALTGYTAILPGEHLWVAGNGTKELAGLQGSHLTRLEEKTLVIEPHQKGSLKVTWPLPDQPIALTILRLDDPYAFPLAEMIKDQGILLSQSEILVAKPTTFALPVGPLLVRVQREKDGLDCQQMIEIKAHLETPLHCHTHSKPSPLSSFWHGEPPLDPATALSYAGGHGITASPQPNQKMGSIQSYDPSEGLMFSLYPVSAKAHQLWLQHAATHGRRPLRHLLQFKESYANQASFIMGCAPKMGLVRFESTLRRLQPDAVQVFGCGHPAYEASLWRIIDRYVEATGKQIIIHPAPPIQPQKLASTGFWPRLVHIGPNQKTRPRDFTLSAGAVLHYENPKEDTLLIKVKPLSPQLKPKRALLIAHGQKTPFPLAQKDGIWQASLSIPPKGPLRVMIEGEDEWSSKLLSHHRRIVLAASQYLGGAP